MGERRHCPQSPRYGDERGGSKESRAVVGEIARELVRETNDPSIYEAFKEANFLHSNFYEFQLSLDDIKNSAVKIEQLVKKLKNLTEKAIKEGEA